MNCLKPETTRKKRVNTENHITTSTIDVNSDSIDEKYKFTPSFTPFGL